MVWKRRTSSGKPSVFRPSEPFFVINLNSYLFMHCLADKNQRTTCWNILCERWTGFGKQFTWSEGRLHLFALQPVWISFKLSKCSENTHHEYLWRWRASALLQCKQCEYLTGRENYLRAHLNIQMWTWASCGENLDYPNLHVTSDTRWSECDFWKAIWVWVWKDQKYRGPL